MGRISLVKWSCISLCMYYVWSLRQVVHSIHVQRGPAIVYSILCLNSGLVTQIFMGCWHTPFFFLIFPVRIFTKKTLKKCTLLASYEGCVILFDLSDPWINYVVEYLNIYGIKELIHIDALWCCWSRSILVQVMTVTSSPELILTCHQIDGLVQDCSNSSA